VRPRGRTMSVRTPSRPHGRIGASVRTRTVLAQVTSKRMLQCVQIMDAPAAIVRPSGHPDVRPSENVRVTTSGVTNEFDNTIRAKPTRWTEECWREVYNFSTGGGGSAGRKDEYVKDYFKELPSPKDGYAIEGCTDPRHRRVLAFLVPILYPEKPNRITVTMGNTIFGVLNGGRKVNWARIITNLVVQLAARVGKSRALPICPFLYHLYERKELLKPEEVKN
jgi:hypothetical protein